jgi:hypothetical protein
MTELFGDKVLLRLQPTWQMNLASIFLHRIICEDNKLVIQSITLSNDLPPHAIASVRRFDDLQSSSEALKNSLMNVIQLWTVPFQDTLIVKLQSQITLLCELVWIRTAVVTATTTSSDRDLNLWGNQSQQLATLS